MTNNSISKALNALSIFNKQADIASSAIDKTISAVANASQSVVQNISMQTTANQVVNLNNNFTIDIINDLITNQNILASNLAKISGTINNEFKLVIEELNLTFEAFKINIENFRLSLNASINSLKQCIGSFGSMLIAFYAKMENTMFSAFKAIGGSSLKLKIPLPLPVTLIKTTSSEAEDSEKGGVGLYKWIHKILFARKKLKTPVDTDLGNFKWQQRWIAKFFGFIGKLIKPLQPLIRFLGKVGLRFSFVGAQALLAVPGLNVIVAIIDVILIVITVIDLLTAAFNWLWKNIDSFRGFVAVVVDIGRQIFEHIASAFSYIGDLVMGFVEKWIIGPVLWVWNGIKNILGGFFSWLTDIVIKIAEWIPGIDTDRLERVRKEAEDNKDMTVGELFGKKKEQELPVVVTPPKMIELDVSSGFAITGASLSTSKVNMNGFVGASGEGGIGGKSITVNTLVEQININVTNLRESTSEVKQTIKKVLLEALRDTQLADTIN